MIDYARDMISSMGCTPITGTRSPNSCVSDGSKGLNLELARCYELWAENERGKDEEYQLLRKNLKGRYLGDTLVDFELIAIRLGTNPLLRPPTPHKSRAR